jgi:hypothetical protein
MNRPLHLALAGWGDFYLITGVASASSDALPARPAEVGGTAGAAMFGPSQDGGFDLWQNGDRCRGWANNGQIVIEWTDQREWGNYQGTLHRRRK